MTKIIIVSVEVLSSLCSGLRDHPGWLFWSLLRKMLINPWRFDFVQKDYDSCLGEWMRFKYIYNMFRFIASIQLLYPKIVEKFQFFRGLNLGFSTLVNQHMSCNFFLFLIFNLHRLLVLEKQKNSYKQKWIQVDFFIDMTTWAQLYELRVRLYFITLRIDWAQNKHTYVIEDAWEF